MGYKTTDGLMKHLRDSGIAISGSKQKRQLINTGYFHGYKGYRYYRQPQNKLPFVSYDEVYATIQYDSALKSLMYGKIMYIETAIKNIVLQRILINSNSESISDMMTKVVSSYKNAPSDATPDQKKKFQQAKLNLQKSIQANLAYAYSKKNPKITHYYNNGYSDVPIWALFEIMTMGDLGHLLSCLTREVRDDISRYLGLNTSCDTNRELIYRYLYDFKDLRNAIAHNSVVFDARFRSFRPSRAMQQCLQLEIGLSQVNFDTIGDYIILMVYYMKLLYISKTEMKAFVREFEKITNNYSQSVNSCVSSIVIHRDLTSRMNSLKNFMVIPLVQLKRDNNS